MNKKLQTKTPEEVLAEMRGTDITITNDSTVKEVSNYENEAA